MSEEKRQLIRDVTTRINKLPVDKQHYILGYMNGVADTVESDTQKEEATIRDSNQRGDDITEQLIPINYSSEQPTVSARELYAGLEITDRFSRWFERMSAYGFAEGSDFTSVKSSTLVNNGADFLFYPKVAAGANPRLFAKDTVSLRRFRTSIQ